MFFSKSVSAIGRLNVAGNSLVENLLVVDIFDMYDVNLDTQRVAQIKQV